MVLLGASGECYCECCLLCHRHTSCGSWCSSLTRGTSSLHEAKKHRLSRVQSWCWPKASTLLPTQLIGPVLLLLLQSLFCSGMWCCRRVMEMRLDVLDVLTSRLMVYLKQRHATLVHTNRACRCRCCWPCGVLEERAPVAPATQTTWMVLNRGECVSVVIVETKKDCATNAGSGGVSGCGGCVR